MYKVAAEEEVGGAQALFDNGSWVASPLLLREANCELMHLDSWCLHSDYVCHESVTRTQTLYI